MSEIEVIDREQLVERLAESVPDDGYHYWGKYDYIRSFLSDLEDFGYKIVPADAVCITPEIAKTVMALHKAAQAVRDAADKRFVVYGEKLIDASVLSDLTEAVESTAMMLAAAALRGEERT